MVTMLQCSLTLPLVLCLATLCTHIIGTRGLPFPGAKKNSAADNPLILQKKSCIPEGITCIPGEFSNCCNGCGPQGCVGDACKCRGYGSGTGQGNNYHDPYKYAGAGGIHSDFGGPPDFGGTYPDYADYGGLSPGVGGPLPGVEPTLSPEDQRGERVVTKKCFGRKEQCSFGSVCEGEFDECTKWAARRDKAFCVIDICAGTCKPRWFSKDTEEEMTYLCGKDPCKTNERTDCQDLCKDAKCTANPKAYCIVDKCGGCNVRWYENDIDQTSKCVVEKDDYVRSGGLPPNSQTADIMVLIDGGWWVSDGNSGLREFMIILTKFADFIKKEVDEGYYRVGLFTFDWIVRKQFCFDKYTYHRDLVKALEEQKSKQLFRDATLMKNTWNTAAKMLNNETCGARRNNADVVFMIWDGEANYLEPAKQAAADLRNKGTVIVCLLIKDVGENSNKQRSIDQASEMCTLSFHQDKSSNFNEEELTKIFTNTKEEIKKKTG